MVDENFRYFIELEFRIIRGGDPDVAGWSAAPRLCLQ